MDSYCNRIRVEMTTSGPPDKETGRYAPDAWGFSCSVYGSCGRKMSGPSGTGFSSPEQAHEAAGQALAMFFSIAKPDVSVVAVQATSKDEALDKLRSLMEEHGDEAATTAEMKAAIDAIAKEAKDEGSAE